MKFNFTWKRSMIALISFVILIIIDQWTKALAVEHLMNQKPLVLIPGVFQLHYLENRGAAFGMLQGQRFFFVVIAILVLAAITYIYFKLPWQKHFHYLRAVGIFVAAGAVGTLIDRVSLGYVVDFFYFELINFPIFNVADIYVTCATFVLAFLILFYYKEEELECLFPKKEK